MEIPTFLAFQVQVPGVVRLQSWAALLPASMVCHMSRISSARRVSSLWRASRPTTNTRSVGTIHQRATSHGFVPVRWQAHQPSSWNIRITNAGFSSRTHPPGRAMVSLTIQWLSSRNWERNIWQICQRKTCSYKTKKMVNHLLMIHHLFILMICCLKR